MCPQWLEASLKPGIDVKKKEFRVRRTQHLWFRPKTTQPTDEERYYSNVWLVSA